MTPPVATRELPRQHLRFVPTSGRVKDYGTQWRVQWLSDDTVVAVRGRTRHALNGTEGHRTGKRKGGVYTFTTVDGHWEVERCGC